MQQEEEEWEKQKWRLTNTGCNEVQEEEEILTDTSGDDMQEEEEEKKKKKYSQY